METFGKILKARQQMSNRIEDYTDEELVLHYRDMQHLSVDTSTKEGLDDLSYYKRLIREMVRRFAILIENKEVADDGEQEPFKPMAEIDLNSVIKQDIIDRYRAESEKKRARVLERARVLNKIRAEIKDIAFDWQEIDGEHESLMVVELNDALNIIDKYKAETE